MAKKTKVMARAKPKKARASKTAQYIADLKFYGDEPQIVGVPSVSALSQAFNWYSYMGTVDEARSYLEEWAKRCITKAKVPAIIKALKRVPDAYVPLTTAWVIRLRDRGAELRDYDDHWIAAKVRQALTHVVALTPEANNTPRPSIQDRVKDRVNDHIANFEDALDARDPAWSAYDYLNQHAVPPLLAGHILEFYGELLTELIAAIQGTDVQLREAYTKLGRTRMKELFNFVNKLCKETERYIASTRKTKVSRNPRKKKSVDPNKLVAKLKYKVEDLTLKVKSINPVNMVGAQEIWLFNAKTRILTVLRANTHAGITLRGVTAHGWDEATSGARKVGRKAQYAVDRVVSGGKIVKRKLLDEFAKVAPVKARFGPDMLILAASKGN